MITEPTVLILGAGAAVDYGFPLGRKLRDLVCGTTRGGFSREIVDAGYDRKELEEFESTLRLSGYTSVDWFLEDRPEFITIGKAAIAAALIPFEKPDDLLPPYAPDQHWYELLVNVLDRPIGSFPENKLSIVTFNYDRSLEYYLLSVLSTRLQSEERAIEMINAFEIVHVHGALGDLMPLRSEGRSYLPLLDPAGIRTASDQILIVGEASGETEEFKIARNLLTNASRIVFLGFGYHPKSVRRLGIFNEPWNDEKKQKVRVGGTSRNIPNHAWQHIREDMLNEAFPSRNRKVETVFEYLNEAEPLDEFAL